MFKYIKSVFSEKSIRDRILFVLFIIAITRVLSIIPIPSISGEDIAGVISGNQFLGLINIFSGGGLATMSIVMIGVQPYITASIITQLLTVLSPKLKAMQQEEGEAGRKRFSAYTRWMTPPLAIMQAVGFLTLFQKQGIIDQLTQSQMIVNVLIITAGSMLMMWLGEVINEKGIGNGISILIFSGIVATLPSQLFTVFKTLDMSQAPLYAALAITFVLVLFGIVAVTEAERPIEVTYAKQSRGYASAGGTTTTYLPLRLTQAGVVPVIFAVSLLSFPQLLAQLLATSSSSFGLLVSSKISDILGNPWIYGGVYFSLIVMFTFFYTVVTFDPIKTSENLQKAGAFIPGHRPGEATTKYMSDVLTHVTTVGAVFLGVVALLPIILAGLTGVSAISVGGTSLLIAVSVVIDLLKKIDAQMTMREY